MAATKSPAGKGDGTYAKPFFTRNELMRKSWGKKFKGSPIHFKIGTLIYAENADFLSAKSAFFSALHGFIR
jgi:hypothetical protein